MKSEQIRAAYPSHYDWLKEIAYQLALLNERQQFNGGNLPTKPGLNSHTFHYSPDTETK
jgi:hypothetical protein